MRSRRAVTGAIAFAILAVVALLVGWRAVSGGDERRASSGDGRPQVTATTAVDQGPATTDPVPAVGYTRDELLPVLDAIAEMVGAYGTPPSLPPPAAPSPGTSLPDDAGPVPGGDTGERARPPSSGDESPSLLLVGFAVAVVLGLATVAVIVVRRRRRRPPHGPPPLPGPDRAKAGPEPAPASAPTPVAFDVAQRVDLALRYAGAALAELGLPAPTSVVCVRVGELGIELLVDPPVSTSPGRFIASADGHELALDPACSIEELAELAHGHRPLCPALITVGTTPEGPVLFDLQRAGTLCVDGDPALVGAFLAGVALELATAPWAADTAVCMVGGDTRLAEPERVRAVDDIDDLGAGLGSASAGSGGQASPATVATGGTRPTVVVIAPGAASPEAVARLSADTGPSELAVVAAGPVSGAAWRLVIAAGGDATLEPLGLELRVGVDAPTVAAAVASLTSPPPAEQVGVVEHRAAGGGSDTDAGPGDAQVRVLGPVTVSWPGLGEGARPNRRKLEEVVAYLGTHGERPVPGERLRTAIWPLDDGERAGEVAHSTFRSTMSRTRATLGRDASGRPFLPESQNGSYRLGPGFSCDWAEFQQLRRQARSATAGEAIELLRAALGLVRGAPFADAPRGCYGWAWTEQLVSEIEVAVGDAAEDLASRALDAGDFATARWATRQGLLVVPYRESLYRARMRAAAGAGDGDDIEQAYTEVCRAARALDEAGPQEETTALYERLRQACRSSASGPSRDAVPAVGPRT